MAGGGIDTHVLPGSNGACRDGWDRLINLPLDSRHRPCSVVGLLPRFQKH
jgi:molybdenum cofactor biosynthesis protein B